MRSSERNFSGNEQRIPVVEMRGLEPLTPYMRHDSSEKDDSPKKAENDVEARKHLGLSDISLSATFRGFPGFSALMVVRSTASTGEYFATLKTDAPDPEAGLNSRLMPQRAPTS